MGVAGELQPLGALFVRVEHEAADVGALQENHPHIGKPVGIDGGHGHGLWIDGLGGLRLLHPAEEQVEGIARLGEIGHFRAFGLACWN